MDKQEFSNGLAAKAHLPIFNIKSLLVALLLNFMLTGCVTTGNLQKVEQLSFGDAPAKILLMPLDVELSLLTAGGLLEPKADWTENAKTYMLAALKNEAQNRSANLVLYNSDNLVSEPAHLQLAKLHEAVGVTVMWNSFQPLPTKKENFDWTLGNSANSLKKEYDAQYALFVFIRDSYSSGGRVAFQILAGLMGASVQGGHQYGFASLVDLNNGDIVWFNLLSKASGELRTETAATIAVKNLMSTLPGG